MLNKSNLKQNFEVFLIKKIFSENYYNKYYIRSNFIDTSTSLYNLKKNNLQGFSLYKTVYCYSHIHNNKFTFNSFLSKRNLYSKFFLKNIYNSLLTLKQKKWFFILLKPIKGGFISYFSGFMGFIPQNNVLFLIKKLFLEIRTILFFIFLYTFVKISNLLKCLRFSTRKIKIKIKYYCKKKNFSSVKSFKFRKLFFNATFLLRKTIKSHNEIKKLKKKHNTKFV